MTGLFNPDNNWEVALLAFLGVIPLVSAAIPLWLKIKKIDTQVSNSHEENLRDEITRGFKEIREDIRQLRGELHTERQERIDGDRREVA